MEGAARARRGAPGDLDRRPGPDLDVTTRTIRRDLAALQEAGFPLYDDRDEQGRTRWHLDGQVLKGLETGFTLGELCALYLGRHVLEMAAGTPFGKDLSMAFARIEKMLSPRMRTFLDQMPAILTAKAGPRASAAGEQGEVATQLLEAALHHRVARMRYHSVSSGRIKDYVVHPERLAFAQGELYLLAFVPEYRDTRTFAFTRITVGVAREADLHAPRRSRRRRLRQLARRAHRPDRAGGDPVRRPRGAVCPGPRLAPVAAAGRRRGRRPQPVDGRLPRLGAAQLDS